MTRFFFHEGTSGCKRKTSATMNKIASKRRTNADETSSSPIFADSSEERKSDKVLNGRLAMDLEDDGGLKGGNWDGEYTFRIDSDVLDCSICFEPLRPPIFQCTNGHIACSSCCPKLLNKCHFCSQSIGSQRCLALEKVIESITIPCKYAINGCRDAVFFTEKNSHEKACTHASLFCPFSDCSFSASKQLLATHINHMHDKDLKKFIYNQSFKVTMKKNQSFMALLAEDGHLFLLLNKVEPLNRNMLSVIVLAANLPKFGFSYKLIVENGEISLRLRASVEKMKKWSGVHPEKVFLVVPDNLCSEMHVYVRINKSSGIFT